MRLKLSLRPFFAFSAALRDLNSVYTVLIGKLPNDPDLHDLTTASLK
jgi:hypothetical protein